MKKLVISILAIIYMVASTGASVNIHYCMGKLADWSMNEESANSCRKCGMIKSKEKDNGCCKDEHKFIKYKNDQKENASFCLNLKTPVADFPNHQFSIEKSLTSLLKKTYPIINSPPKSGGLPVYILISTFLI